MLLKQRRQIATACQDATLQECIPTAGFRMPQSACPKHISVARRRAQSLGSPSLIDHKAVPLLRLRQPPPSPSSLLSPSVCCSVCCSHFVVD